MKTGIIPTYGIAEFILPGTENNFYANTFKAHLKQHGSLRLPHKHNFYLSILFTRGNGTYEIDFRSYDIKRGTIIMLAPGQVHNWELSKDIDGYIFIHTKDFFDLYFLYEKGADLPFHSFLQNSAQIILKKAAFKDIEETYREITEEYAKNKLMKFQKISSLINVLYITLSREYIPKTINKLQSLHYSAKLKQQQDLINIHFRTIKSPRAYAAMMHISGKHLNRICKICLNKTASEVITERIILESKRMLVYSRYNISEITEELGYEDNSYFSRIFKKSTGKTPQEYLNEFRN